MSVLVAGFAGASTDAGSSRLKIRDMGNATLLPQDGHDAKPVDSNTSWQSISTQSRANSNFMGSPFPSRGSKTHIAKSKYDACSGFFGTQGSKALQTRDLARAGGFRP